MPTEDFPERALKILADHRDHFWFVHRNHVVADALRMGGKSSRINMRILDLGCGAGTIAYYLFEKGYQVDASDLFQSARSFLGQSLECNFFAFDLLNQAIPDARVGQYDVVVLGDVIEHFSDPVAVLKKARKFLKINGRIVVTVPALAGLWTDYDVKSGHKKRYNQQTLRREIKEAKYVVEMTAYFMLIPAFLLFFQRKLAWIFKPRNNDYTNVLQINPVVNLMMKAMMRLEYLLSRVVPLPIGSSLIGIGVMRHEG